MMFLRQNKIRFSVALLGVVLLIALGYLIVGQTIGRSSPPPAVPPSVNLPPIYPNAANITTDFTTPGSVKYASFQSSDSATDVQNYYKNVLQADGWKVDTVSMPETPDSLYFSWSGHPYHYDCAMNIIISTSTDGLLNVKITLVYHNLIL